jgi:DNA invertase Pin-like site-specific DNA recombinase
MKPKSKFHEKMGAKGGTARSKAKTKAARENGKKGGRPPIVGEAYKLAAAFYLNNGGSLAQTMRAFNVYRRPLLRMVNAARSSA